MGWKTFSGGFIMFLIIFLLVFWLFFPYQNQEFRMEGSSNFSIESQSILDSQFYSNMRFPYSKITYSIGKECSLQKQNDMEYAFLIIANKTILEFEEVINGEEILVNCNEESKIQGGLFIAGEGGPTNISKSGQFNVIKKGKVLLIRKSSCPNPNIAIHEILHVLGFNHSINVNNVMYPVSKCYQEIGEDTIQLINEIYSILSLPDLTFSNVSAQIHGRYLDIEMTIKNEGLIDSKKINIEIFADNDSIKQIYFEELGQGFGRKINIKNIGVNQISINEVKISISAESEELDLENNIVVLTID